MSECTACFERNVDRFPTSNVLDPRTNSPDVFDGVANSAWRPEPPFESGGGGLVATVDDFAFRRMTLSRGRHGREQILSRASVERMTCDQVTESAGDNGRGKPPCFPGRGTSSPGTRRGGCGMLIR